MSRTIPRAYGWGSSTAKVQHFHILWYSIALYNTSKQGKITPENTE